MKGLPVLGLLLASPAMAADGPAPFFLSVPASGGEPKKSEAEVQFVSNGYWLSDKNCVVTRSSGSLEADKQACHTVIFRASSKPASATAPVWIPEPVSGSFAVPMTRSNGPPITTNDYPSASLNKGEQGTVVLRVVVGADGKVADCSVASSSGYERLDNVAKSKFCRRLKLKPAIMDGIPVESVNFGQVAFYSGN